MKKDKEENDEGEDGEEEKRIWYDCLTGLEGVSDTHDGGLIEEKYGGFCHEKWKNLGEGLGANRFGC